LLDSMVYYLISEVQFIIARDLRRQSLSKDFVFFLYIAFRMKV